LCVCMCMCACACVGVCVGMGVLVCVCVYVCTHTCKSIQTYTMTYESLCNQGCERCEKTALQKHSKWTSFAAHIPDYRALYTDYWFRDRSHLRHTVRPGLRAIWLPPNRTYIHIYTNICIHVFIHKCINIYMCLCICIYE